jgi:hypothetical protein
MAALGDLLLYVRSAVARQFFVFYFLSLSMKYLYTLDLFTALDLSEFSKIMVLSWYTASSLVPGSTTRWKSAVQRPPAMAQTCTSQRLGSADVPP